MLFSKMRKRNNPAKTSNETVVVFFDFSKDSGIRCRKGVKNFFEGFRFKPKHDDSQ